MVDVGLLSSEGVKHLGPWPSQPPHATSYPMFLLGLSFQTTGGMDFVPFHIFREEHREADMAAFKCPT